MKYAKFGLILLSVLSMSGCADKTTNSEAPTDFLGSMTASISNGLSAIPETLSKYTGGAGDSEELAMVKQQLAQTEQRMQVLLQANAKHVQALQSERIKLQQEKDTLDLAMRQLKQLKRQLANQDGLLMELQKILSAAELEVAGLSPNGKGVSGKKAQQHSSVSRQAPNSAVKQQKPKTAVAHTAPKPAPALKAAQKSARQNLQQQQKIQQQKKIQQLRRAEQQKKLQQARMLQQQKQKQAQQARIRQQQAAQRIKLQQAAQQKKLQQQQPAQNSSNTNNNQLQALLQQRKRKQQEMQRLNKEQTPKKLESLALPN